MSNTTNPCTGTGKGGSFAYGTPNGHVVCPDCGRIVKAYPGGKVRSHKPAERHEVAHTIEVVQTGKHSVTGKPGHQPVCTCGWQGAVLYTRAGGVSPANRAAKWGDRHLEDMKALAALQAEHETAAVLEGTHLTDSGKAKVAAMVAAGTLSAAS